MTTAQINKQLAALDTVRKQITTKEQARKFLTDAGIIKPKKSKKH